MHALKRPLALLMATGALSLGPALVACNQNENRASEALEEIQDEAKDAVDEIEDEIDDHM